MDGLTGSNFILAVILWRRPRKQNKKGYISTNNIATGMVRGGCKYAFNSPKVRFHQIISISTNNIATGIVHDGRKYTFNSPKVRFHHTISLICSRGPRPMTPIGTPLEPFLLL
jgi:hypothetical protein